MRAFCTRYRKGEGSHLSNTDGTFELSRFSNGNIFNDLRIDDIIIEDSEQNKNLVEEKILYEQSVNKNINNKKETNEITEMKNEDITVENSSAKMNPKNTATNYVLEKLSKAGIEVVTDKEEFDRILGTETVLQKMSDENETNLLFLSHKNFIEFSMIEEANANEPLVPAEALGKVLLDYALDRLVSEDDELMEEKFINKPDSIFVKDNLKKQLEEISFKNKVENLPAKFISEDIYSSGINPIGKVLTYKVYKEVIESAGIPVQKNKHYLLEIQTDNNYDCIPNKDYTKLNGINVK